MLIKFWLEVGKEEQERRFAARIDDPLRQWKLSPIPYEEVRREKVKLPKRSKEGKYDDQASLEAEGSCRRSTRPPRKYDWN